MPIYEYQCGECGHRLETLQKISDLPLKTCPACQRDGLAKLVSASSFRLKGGGWYETDFKTGSRRHGTQDVVSGDAVKGGAAKTDSAKTDSTSKGKETGSAVAKPATTGSGS